jgi:hypothetical protein
MAVYGEFVENVERRGRGADKLSVYWHRKATSFRVFRVEEIGAALFD